MSRNEIINKTYPKSNVLIHSIYRADLFQNKLFAIILSCLADGKYAEDNDGNLCVAIKAAEIKDITKCNPKNLYGAIDKAAQNMMGTYIGIANPEEKTFTYVTVILSSSYKNCIFTVLLNKIIKPFLVDLKKNFTLLHLEQLMQFRRESSFRLYELLNSMMYKKYEDADSGKYTMCFGLNELKFKLGVLNDKVKQKANSIEKVDASSFDDLYESLPEKEQKYRRWSDFRDRIIRPAITEINEKSDISVKYEPQSYGKSHKLYKIDFHVYHKSAERVETDAPEETCLMNEQMFDLIAEIKTIVNLPPKDCTAIAKAADYDIEKVKQAKVTLDAYPSEVSNITGFLLKAINEGYTIASRDKKPIHKPVYHGFHERTYDYDELETKLLNA